MTCPKCGSQAKFIQRFNLRSAGFVNCFDEYVCVNEQCQCRFLVETAVQAPEPPEQGTTRPHIRSFRG